MAKKRSKVRWEKPPDRRRTTAAVQDHKELAGELKANPGEWGHVLTYSAASTAGSVAQGIRSGRPLAWYPAGAFDAVARTVSGQHRVYAVYKGGEVA